MRYATLRYLLMERWAGLLLSLGVLVSPAYPYQSERSSIDVEARELQTKEDFSLSIRSIIERIDSQNLQLLVERESVFRALQQSYQRRAALLPQLSLASQQRREQLSQGFFGEMFEIDPFNSFNIRAESSVTLFDAQQYADYKVAEIRYAIARLDFEVVRQNLLEEALNLYFTILRDARSIEIGRENLARGEDLLRLASELFDAGAGVKIDVTRAEVGVAADQRLIMDARTDFTQSSLLLKELLDIDLSRSFDVDRAILDQLNNEPPVEAFLQNRVATEIRNEVAIGREKLRAVELEERATEWRRLPRVELFADWGYDSDEAFDGDYESAWVLGLRARLPLWEGGRIRAERLEAQAATRQEAYRLRAIRNRIEREFESALEETQTRYAQIEIARKEVSLGKAEVQLANERYQEGLGGSRDVVDAQRRLVEAERGNLRAIYLYGLSRIALARSVGSVESITDF